MPAATTSRRINIAVAGLGNCAASLIEGICFYRLRPNHYSGLLFPSLGGYTVGDIDLVVAFDIAQAKVGRQVRQAIYQPPNNFVPTSDIRVDCGAPVLRGPTLDGNPAHLARLVAESERDPVDVPGALRDYGTDVLVNLLPTGSIEATEFYAHAALEAGCAFVNCIPTVLAQRPELQQRFTQRGLPLFGDDVKSQIGATILHRAFLHLLESRGASLGYWEM
jgi:myo-inositol-1-phosphate synthase